MFTVNTASWTAPAASRGWWSAPGSWARPRWPSPITASCTAWWTFIRPPKRRVCTPFSAARSMWPPAPGTTRCTAWTASTATWCCCARTKPATATWSSWFPPPGRKGFTAAPGWTGSCSPSTTRASSPCPPAWPGKFPALCAGATSTAQRPSPCGTGICSARTTIFSNCRITACPSRRLSIRKFSASLLRPGSPWSAPTTPTICAGRMPRCRRCWSASRPAPPWTTPAPWPSPPRNSPSNRRRRCAPCSPPFPRPSTTPCASRSAAGWSWNSAS